MKIRKLAVFLLKKLELGSALGVRLTQWTGKSKYPLHPKHLLEQPLWFKDWINRDDVVLDLGSNNGQSTFRVARFAKKIEGIEIDPALLKIARSSIKKNQKDITFREGNLEDSLPYPSNSFTVVLMTAVLEHINKRDELLLEIYRVLKSKGIVILSVPNNDTSWKKLQRKAGINSFVDEDHKIEFTERDIKALLERNHFVIENISYGKYDTPLRGLIDILGGLSLNLYKYLDQWRYRKSLNHSSEAESFQIIARKNK